TIGNEKRGDVREAGPGSEQVVEEDIVCPACAAQGESVLFVRVSVVGRLEENRETPASTSPTHSVRSRFAREHFFSSPERSRVPPVDGRTACRVSSSHYPRGDTLGTRGAGA